MRRLRRIAQRPRPARVGRGGGCGLGLARCSWSQEARRQSSLLPTSLHSPSLLLPSRPAPPPPPSHPTPPPPYGWMVLEGKVCTLYIIFAAQFFLLFFSSSYELLRWPCLGYPKMFIASLKTFPTLFNFLEAI